MKSRKSGWIAGIGCAFLAVMILAVAVAVAAVVYIVPLRTTRQSALPTFTAPPAVQQPEPMVTVQAPALRVPETLSLPGESQLADASDRFSRLYRDLSPGVVNIQVLVADAPGGAGIGAGSGFVLDDQGHIVTNDHVVSQATEVIVVFHDGFESEAKIVGTDDDSDLAIIKVEQLPASIRPLPLADSDSVNVGDWAIAIGNPFGLGNSMSLGIVSAVGRSIPSGATPFAIPQAIQTDAAINPGNSGGPLINLAGQVIGVNAQIRTTGAGVNSGVGFAIPSNVVRQVAPRLIAFGSYECPWLGVEGGSVSLLLKQANELESQYGAYISAVVEGGPAERAGLRGTQDVAAVEGIDIPVGGDVIVEIDGQPVQDFNDLLSQVSFRQPGDAVILTIVRDGQRIQRTVTLEARPGSRTAN